MGDRLKYILIMLFMVVSCADRFHEPDLSVDTIRLAANSSMLITKSGLQYTDFDEDTQYLLYALETPAPSEDYDWSNTVMYDVDAVEDSKHLVDYIDEDTEELAFSGKKLDFYGLTLCSKSVLPENTSIVSAPVVEIEIDENTGEFPDLMYSDNLKSATADMGLLQMNFRHALAKIQVEVSRQDDPDVSSARILEISLENTAEAGAFSVTEGTWSRGPQTNERIIYSGDMEVTTAPAMVTDQDGKEAEVLMIPNTGTVNLKVKLTLDGNEIKEISYPIYKVQEADPDTGLTPDSTDPFLFEENHRYVLSVIILDNGVRILAVAPQVYDWISVPLEPYLGQPITFGGLMWMDRNLGATSADCRNEWEETRGFYYQYGRNIPYIFDSEKYEHRSPSTELTAKYGEPGSKLDIGLQYFYTYDNTGKRVYGAVEGGLLTGFSTTHITGEWVKLADGWSWSGIKLWHMANPAVNIYDLYSRTITPAHRWEPNPTIIKNGKLIYQEGMFFSNDEGFMYWEGPNVTSGNIAINPGDDKPIYQFIIDARSYHDHWQSGSWCVNDCLSCYQEGDTSNEKNYRWLKTRATTSTAGYTGYTEAELVDLFFTSGCQDTINEDTETVNSQWVYTSPEGKQTPRADNHPCPKGWRIPMAKDFATILPDHQIYTYWGSAYPDGSYMFCTPKVLSELSSEGGEERYEAVIVGVENSKKVVYMIKNLGRDDCYRIRMTWEESRVKRDSLYNLGGNDPYISNGSNMHYIQIERFPGDRNMNFNYTGDVFTPPALSNGSIPFIADGTITVTPSVLWSEGFYDYDWSNPSEVLQIPACGFIYPWDGNDGLYADGFMTILRCADYTTSYTSYTTVGGEKVYNKGTNESDNWCAYLRTDTRIGLFNASRKSLGCQIRCVRDVNAD